MSVNEGLTGAWVTTRGGAGRIVADASAYRQHASMTSAVTVGSSRYGWVTNYNTSTGATLGYSGHLQTGFPFSCAAWVKYTGAGTAGREIFHTDTDTGTVNYWGWSLGAIYSGTLNQDIFLLRYGNGTTANRAMRASGPAVLVVDDWYHVVVAVRAHITGDIWINGVRSGSVWSGSGTGLAHNAGTGRIGYDTRTSRAWTNDIADVRTWRRPLEDSEVKELYAGGPGYGVLAPRKYWRVRVAAVAVSGSAAVTLGAATCTVSGTQTYSGSAAATLAAATATATGSQTHSGTAAATTGPATSAASGTQTISGSGSSTLGDATSTASGTQGTGTIGTAAVTLGAATASASGGQTFSGTGTPSCGAATSTASGSLVFAGPGSATLGAATASATGTQTYTGTAAVTLGTAYATASGSVASGPITGTAAVTLGTAYASASGSVLAPMAPIFGVTVDGWTLRVQADTETLTLDADAQTLRVTGG